MKRSQQFCVPFLLFMLGGAAADSVTDQIEAGVKAYQSGKYRQAITEFNYAIAEIQSKIDEEARKVLPDPLAGWKAEEAQAQGMAMMGMAGTTISREYYREDNGERVEIRLIADSPMNQAMAMMMSNPMIMQSDPTLSVFRHKGKRGLMKHRQGSREWEATLLLGNGRILVQVEGSSLKDNSPVLAYLDALDLEKIEKTLTGP